MCAKTLSYGEIKTQKKLKIMWVKVVNKTINIINS